MTETTRKLIEAHTELLAAAWDHAEITALPPAADRKGQKEQDQAKQRAWARFKNAAEAYFSATLIEGDRGQWRYCIDEIPSSKREAEALTALTRALRADPGLATVRALLDSGYRIGLVRPDGYLVDAGEGEHE